MARRLAAIMFTDLVGFTASAQTDEAGALDQLREQERLVRPILGPYGGREVKSTGDGFLVEFESALKATECAVEIQRRLRSRNEREPRSPIQLRIGVHVGDVEETAGDIFGDAVNVASRIVPLAEPGGVCLSEHVFSHVRGKISYPLVKLPPSGLKGIQEPLAVYRLVLPWIGQGPAVGASSVPRIAVLPLANISPDPKDEFFADGLTEELITVLSQVKGLRVISRTSVNQYKGTTKPVAQIGTELGADSVLEGSVRKAGEQLRIAVQLIDTRTDEHRWAQTYDRKLENVFAIQADVAERTASALKVELLRSEREAVQARPTSNLAAYEAYLRGMRASQRFSELHSEEVDREAQAFFEEAIREDPRFAAAYAYLAHHLIMVGGEIRPTKEEWPKARELVATALELNPNSSEARTARANLLMQGDLAWDRAEGEYQQAIALNPSNSVARQWYAGLLMVLQRFSEGAKQYRAAIEQDPLNVAPKVGLVHALMFEGDTGSAVALTDKLTKEYPDQLGVLGGLAWVYAVTGRADEALRALEPLAGSSNPALRATRSLGLVLLGRPEEARAFFAEWEAGRLPGWFPLRYAAAISAGLGEYDRALDLLERDRRDGEGALWNVYLQMVFDPVREYPRFVALLKTENLPTAFVGHRPRWAGPPHA